MTSSLIFSPATTYNLVFDGDSIMWGQSGGQSASLAPPAVVGGLWQARYPTKTVTVYNLGIPGNSWNYDFNEEPTVGTMISRAPTYVHPYCDLPRTWVGAFAGTNGLSIQGNSAAVEYGHFLTYFNACVSAGLPPARFITGTILPRAPDGGTLEARRLAYNTLLIDGAATYGYTVARFDLNAEIGDPSSYSNTMYYLDNLHPTVAGEAIMAQIIYETMIATEGGTFTADTTPSAFSFTDTTDAAVSTVYTSAAITVAGITPAHTSAISISGGTYAKNGGSFTSSAGTVVVGDAITVRLTSSGTDLTAVSATVTIGGVSDTYTVTTADAASGLPAFNPSQKGADITLTNADKTASMTGSSWQTVKTVTGHSTGKWYFEFTINNSTGGVFGGLADAGASISNYLGSTANSCGFNGGNAFVNGFTAGSTGVVSNVTGAVNAIAVDMDAKKLWVLVNGAVVGGGDPVAGTSAFVTWSAAYTLYGAVTLGGNGGVAIATNTYSPPTGYTAWG